MSYDHSPFDRPGHWPFHMARHHGGRGFGHFAAGFMGGMGRGGPGFRTGRKLAAADLQLLILSLLAEKPSHGYELIKALEEASSGFYSPSPGMIYPALTYLEEIGFATVATEGAKKLYHITDAGRQHLDENRAGVDAMRGELERIGGKMERVRRVFAGEESAMPGEDDFLDPRGPEGIRAARRALRMALHQKHHCPPEEARRIAEILQRAAAEILEK